MNASGRVARGLVRTASLLAPAAARARMRREWEAELVAAEQRGENGLSFLRFALGAFADGRTLRAIARSKTNGSEDLMGWTSSWIREARVAIRSLLRAPAYSAVAVLTLALGLGGSAAIYTLLDRVVLQPLPYPEPERLVRIENAVPNLGPDVRWNTSTAQYVYFTEHSEKLDAVGIYTMGGVNVQTPAGPERVRSASVTAEVLQLLGARALFGRLMSVQDNAGEAPLVAVVSHGFWQRALGSDPDIVGRTMTLQDRPVEVIGVLAPGLDLPDAPSGSSTEVWLPLRFDRAGTFYNDHAYRMVARLAEGADTLSAETELAQLTTRFPEAFPRAYSPGFLDDGFRSVLTPLKSSVVGGAARTLWIVVAGVGLVLLIACANVANLFLVRMEARRRELAVRAAIGAGRGQVARYLVSEGLVLAGSGAVLALLVSQLALSALPALGFYGLPRLDGVGLGSGTVLFTVALALLVGVGLALHPMLLHARGSTAAVLGEAGRSGSGGPSSSHFRSALVVTQVATALVLAVSAALLMESMRRLTSIDPGIDTDGVLTMEVNLTFARYPDDPSIWRFYREAIERLGGVPGVLAAGVTTELPLNGRFGCTVQGFEDPAVIQSLNERALGTCASQLPTSPGYFEAIGIPLVSGRTFENGDNDQPGRASVVVSHAFAERFWPGQDPLGKRVAPNGRDEGFYNVVGVVGDIPTSTLDGERAIAIYYPVVPDPSTGVSWFRNTMRLVVKTGLSDPAALLPSIRQAIAGVDPNVPIANVQLAADLIDQSMASLSFTALLLGVAASTALLLAAVGLYGVLSYAVTRRTREIGMRIAIGARPGQVEWMVVAQSLGLASIGLLVGMIAAFAGTRVLAGLLYGVEPTDPTAFVGAAAVLLIVALLASWIPARRAARVDPSVALREA